MRGGGKESQKKNSGDNEKVVGEDGKIGLIRGGMSGGTEKTRSSFTLSLEY